MRKTWPMFLAGTLVFAALVLGSGTTGSAAALGARQAVASPTAKPRPRPPAATPTQVIAAPLTTIPEPSATPSLPHFAPLTHSIVYDNGVQALLAPASGSAPVALANLSSSPYPFKRPRYAGWQFMYYDAAFYLGDVFGHHTPIAAPIAQTEQVFDAWPSPDGQYIAWVLVKPGPWDGAIFSMGASRVVITDQTGGNARVVVQQSIDAFGGVPIIYGWRYGRPPTLLVQNSYGFAGLHKGLEEYNPVVNDLVSDWLPPTGSTVQPAGEVLNLSPGGNSIAFATSDLTLPTGEGPLPANINVMSHGGRHVSNIDVSAGHHDKALPKQPAPTAYAFSRQAFISPDETLIAYTRLDAIYPKGAIAPLIRPIACIARTNGAGRADLAPGYRVMGWIDNNTLVLRKDEAPGLGLYSYNITNNQATLIVSGPNLNVEGIVP
jgi:hypothetical protein